MCAEKDSATLAEEVWTLGAVLSVRLRRTLTRLMAGLVGSVEDEEAL